MADGGTVFGLFIALIVLICGVPTISLLLGYWRRHTISQQHRIEVQLASSAKKFITAGREHIVACYIEDSRHSIKAKSIRMLTEAATNTGVIENKFIYDTISLNSDETINSYFRHALQNLHVFWGIEDIILPSGKSRCFTMPAGLFEDFLFYIFNNVNPLPFVFGDKDHPETLSARFVVYCTAQAFTLMLFLLIEDYTVRQIFGILMSPVILVIEYWLQNMLLCPCLDSEESNLENEYNDSQTSDSMKTTKGNVTKKGCRAFLRVLGGFLAFPLLAFLIICLVITAMVLGNRKDEGDDLSSLALFLWNGIMFPFLLNIFKASVNFWWFCVPIHINICGYNLFAVNSWTETRLWEQDMLDIRGLTREERLDVLAQRKRTKFSSADFMHVSCHCLKFSGQDTDSHFDIDVCSPSLYCHRCCEGIHSWYWEEGNNFTIQEIRMRKKSFSNVNAQCLNNDYSHITRDVEATESCS